MTVQLHPSWLTPLAGEFEHAYMRELKQFLQTEKQQGQIVFPRGKHIFNALDSTPLDQVKVVILGQDPYHGPGQAHGLCFSVPPGVAIPPSLVNIHKEIQADLGIENHSGHLAAWASQGVLLLNSVLTVRQGQAASHQGRGWERFTDRVIDVVNQQCSHVVFMLWGAYAQKKAAAVDPQKHLILKAPHPSPLSAHRGFLGCRHFSQCNQYLSQQQKTPIDWALPSK